eukprot:UN24093
MGSIGSIPQSNRSLNSIGSTPTVGTNYNDMFPGTPRESSPTYSFDGKSTSGGSTTSSFTPFGSNTPHQSSNDHMKRQLKELEEKLRAEENKELEYTDALMQGDGTVGDINVTDELLGTIENTIEALRNQIET